MSRVMNCAEAWSISLRTRWGGLAWLVLSNWHIERTDDFGRMVYAMVARGELSTTDDDHPDHFRSVVDLREALDA